MYREYYAFGGVRLCLCGEEPWQNSPMCDPFRAQPGSAAHIIYVSFRDVIPDPPQNAVQHACLWRWREGGRLCLMQRYDRRYSSFALRDGDRTQLYFSPEYRRTLSARVILESAGLFDLLAGFGMLILHSSYIMTQQGEGILFSGPSGAGKSTQAALWERFAGARIVNGDRALVHPEARTVHGIFYAGTSGICLQESAPLRAIVLPVQAQENRVSLPAKRAAFAALINQCAYYPWAEDSASRMTELAAQLVTNVPVYRLECRKDEGAVAALSEELRRSDYGIQQR